MKQARERVLERAWALQQASEAERGAAAEREAEREAWARAASEVGLEPRWLAQAEAELATEQAEAEARARAAAEARRARVRGGLLAAAAVGLLVAVGSGAWVGWRAWTAAPPPIVEAFDGPGAWTMGISPGTEARAAVEGGTAVLEVTRFAPQGDGTYYVNLNRESPQELSGYEALSLRVRGEGLTTIRVYLETPSTRWRSPAIAVGPEWREVSLPLAGFDYQTLDGAGAWKRSSWEAPEAVQRISLKVGHYMNAADQQGRVYVDDLVIR